MKHRFVAIDVETRNLTEEQLKFEGLFVKAHPGTKDVGKKEAQMEVKKASLTSRGALTNTADIACIGIYTQGMEPLSFNTFGSDREVIENQFCFDSEEQMLLAVTDYLNMMCDQETEVVVANASFDLPKIRFACLRNRVAIPEILKPRAENPIYDVLYMASKYFFVGNQQFISLDELTRRLAIGEGKMISGAEIPGLIEEGFYSEVIAYNELDVLMTGIAYLIMTGRYIR